MGAASPTVGSGLHSSGSVSHNHVPLSQKDALLFKVL